MKDEPGRVWRVITFEASCFDEGVCGAFRAFLMHRLFVRPALIGAWEATGSGTVFLEADGGKSGWLCVELESPRLDCVSSLELSSVEAYKRRISKHKYICRGL